MAHATVKEFRPEAGFGTLALDDGTELSFDVAICTTRHVAVGAHCDVTLGTGLRGQPVAALVKFALAREAKVPLEAFIAFAHDNGLFREWTLGDFAGRLEKPGTTLDAPRAVRLFDVYYGRGLTARGRREGVFVADWRNDAERTGAVASFASIAALGEVRPLRDFGDTVVLPDVEGDVPESVELTGTLEPLAAWFDERLERCGRPERWIALPSAADFEVFVLRDPRTTRRRTADLPLF